MNSKEEKKITALINKNLCAFQSTSKMPKQSLPSNTVVHRLFKVLDINLFNTAFSGVKIKWLSSLKSRTAVSLVCFNSNYKKKNFIGLSSNLLVDCTRKTIVQSIMYEMILLYIEKKLSKKADDMNNNNNNNVDDEIDVDDNNKMVQSMLKRAMDVANKLFGTDLSFNYTFNAHKVIKSSSQWIDVGNDDVHFNQLNNTIVCVSDDDSDIDDTDIYYEITKEGFTGIKPVKERINIQHIEGDRGMPINHLMRCTCCPDYNKLYRDHFIETKLYAPSIFIFRSEHQDKHCPLCFHSIEKNGLEDHLNNSCILFSI